MIDGTESAGTTVISSEGRKTPLASASSVGINDLTNPLLQRADTSLDSKTVRSRKSEDIDGPAIDVDEEIKIFYLLHPRAWSTLHEFIQV